MLFLLEYPQRFAMTMESNQVPFSYEKADRTLPILTRARKRSISLFLTKSRFDSPSITSFQIRYHLHI